MSDSLLPPSGAAPALQPGDSVEAFVRSLTASATALQAAAAMLVRLCAADPTVCDRIIAAAPSLTRAFLDRLRRVGLGMLHPELFMASGRVFRRIEQLSIDEQSRLLAARTVEVVVDAETGDFRRVPLESLTAEQVDQVFGYKRVLSHDEQRAILARRAAERAAEAGAERARASGAAWRMVDGALVVIRAPLTLTRAEAARIFGFTA